MRHMILFVVLVVLSPAAYLYQNQNICVDDYYFVQSDQTLHFLPSGQTDYLTTTYKDQTFVGGFDYNTTSGICAPTPILQYLQITNDQYHFLIALVAVLSGFIFLFFSVYIAVEVAKK